MAEDAVQPLKEQPNFHDKSITANASNAVLSH